MYGKRPIAVYEADNNDILNLKYDNDFYHFIINNKLKPILGGEYLWYRETHPDYNKIIINKYDNVCGAVANITLQNPAEFLKYLKDEYKPERIIVKGMGTPFVEMRKIISDKND
jgi:hypothetical protein